jgi:hypothetical protein
MTLLAACLCLGILSATILRRRRRALAAARPRRRA